MGFGEYYTFAVIGMLIAALPVGWFIDKVAGLFR